MATGYTHKIGEDPKFTFQQFAVGCMRAFGACIEQRDDDMNDAPKLRKKSKRDNYHFNKLNGIRERIKAFKKIKGSKLKERGLKRIVSGLRYNFEAIEREQKLRVRYEAMLKEARAYQPPTTEHENFKKFMIEQLESSLKFDCGGSYHTDAVIKLGRELTELSARSEKRRLKEEIDRDLEYHTKHFKEDMERDAGANKWIIDAYTSLGLPAPTV